jgi:hypothetical protein
MKRKDKGRLPPFVPLLISTIDSPAWRAMSQSASGSKSFSTMGISGSQPMKAAENNDIFLLRGACARKRGPQPAQCQPL